MTAELFTEWLLGLHSNMMKQKQKILLLIDNCTAHNNLPELGNVRVEFLPPNTTSCLQPLDQGVIKKVLYHKEIVTLHSDIQNEVKVTQKYLVKEHTQMERDSMHTRIEKTIKGRDVYLPFEYVKYTKEAQQTQFVQKERRATHVLLMSDASNTFPQEKFNSNYLLVEVLKNRQVLFKES